MGKGEDMAQDDFSTIAYYILKYLYACAKEGIKVREEILMLTEYPVKIKESFAEFVLITLLEEGYIKGLQVYTVSVLGRGEVKMIQDFSNSKITMKGIAYLEDNSKTAKAYEKLKMFRDLIPFI